MSKPLELSRVSTSRSLAAEPRNICSTLCGRLRSAPSCCSTSKVCLFCSGSLRAVIEISGIPHLPSYHEQAKDYSIKPLQFACDTLSFWERCASHARWHALLARRTHHLGEAREQIMAVARTG